MTATTFAMDAMSFLIAAMVDRKGTDIRLEAAMAKLFTTEESWDVIYDAIQIRGGRGFETYNSLEGRKSEAFALERAMRDSRVNTILEGSTEIMATVLSSKSTRKRRTTSSTKEDFPEPPVPVTPNTGGVDFTRCLTCCRISALSSGKFSDAEMTLAIACWSLF